MRGCIENSHAILLASVSSSDRVCEVISRTHTQYFSPPSVRVTECARLYRELTRNTSRYTISPFHFEIPLEVTCFSSVRVTEYARLYRELARNTSRYTISPFHFEIPLKVTCFSSVQVTKYSRLYPELTPNTSRYNFPPFHF